MTEASAWERLAKGEEYFRHCSRIFFALTVVCACGWGWVEPLRWFSVVCWAFALQTSTLASCTRQLKTQQAVIDMLQMMKNRTPS